MKNSMTKGQWLAIGLVAMVTLVLVLLATQVAGTQVRTATNVYEIGVISLGSEVLSRGVPVTMGVDLGRVSTAGVATVLLLRSQAGVTTIGGINPADVALGEFRVSLPCDVVTPDDNNVRLVLVDGRRGVLAQSESVVLAEPGPDCFYSDRK